MVKKIIFVSLSIVMIYLSYQLVSIILLNSPDNYTLFLTVVNSIGIGTYITGIFAFTGFVLPTHRLIGSNYYKIRDPKLLKTIYKLFGLDYFRKALLFFFWGFKKNRAKYFNGTKGGLQDFLYETKQSEFGHLASIITIVPVSFLLFFEGFVLFAVATSIINIIGNLFPIILQRHHRIRIEQILITTASAR